MTGFVYRWTNNVNGKQYIGSHKGDPNDGYVGSGKIFKQALLKHGLENFTREILESEIENFREREQFYLDFYQCASDPQFYNLKPVAGGGFELWNTDANLEARRARLDGVRHLARRFKGKRHSEDSKQRTSDSVKQTFKERGLCRRVRQMTKDYEFVRDFDSLTEAGKSVNTPPSNIQGACDGRLKIIKNFRWKYV